MLKLGGYINIFIAVSHLIGFIWAEQVFQFFRIAKKMEELAQLHSSFPFLLTLFVSIVFLIFGLYGLSADGKFGELPLLKFVIFFIASLYLLRGVLELVGLALRGTNIFISLIYTFLALFIGFLFLFGGLKKWKTAKNR